MASYRLLIALVAATLGLAVAPSVAWALPPDNDHYLNSTLIHDPDDPVPPTFEDAVNTDEATVQSDLFDPPGTFSNGAEVTRCDFPDGRKAHYGRTVWYDFFPHVDGVVRIEAAGFDAVIGLVPYNDDAEPFYNEWVCADHPTRSAGEVAFFDVQRDRSYSIQIGGWGGNEGQPGAGPGNADSGDLEFFFDFFPDTDSDGILDESDNCDTVPGLSQYNGCPDADGDGVPEPPDACPGVKGTLANGCNPPPPCPNGDGDNLCDDGPDQCVGENSRARDANGNGCLDLAPMDPRWLFNVDTYFVRRGGRNVILGLIIRRFGVADVPKGARVVVTCTRRACGRLVKRAKSRVTFPQLRGDKLRAGVKLTIRVTAPGYVGKARVFTIEKNDYSFTRRCIMPGSSRLQRRCSPVR